jgi:acyl-CoA thioester hydrolase
MIVPRAAAARSRLPPPPPTAVSAEFEIPFADVDPLEVAWFGNYPRYVDLGRTALLRSRDLDNDALRALGVVFMVSESFIHHASALRYADRARLTAWFLDVENRLRIGWRIVNVATGALAAEGWLALVTVRVGGGLCLETPPEVLARLRAPGAGSAGER